MANTSFMTLHRPAALVVLTLGTLVLAASATGVVLELRTVNGDFPLAQLLVAVVVGVGMFKAAAVLGRDRLNLGAVGRTPQRWDSATHR